MKKNLFTTDNLDYRLQEYKDNLQEDMLEMIASQGDCYTTISNYKEYKIMANLFDNFMFEGTEEKLNNALKNTKDGICYLPIRKDYIGINFQNYSPNDKHCTVMEIYDIMKSKKEFVSRVVDKEFQHILDEIVENKIAITIDKAPNYFKFMDEFGKYIKCGDFDISTLNIGKIAVIFINTDKGLKIEFIPTDIDDDSYTFIGIKEFLDKAFNYKCGVTNKAIELFNNKTDKEIAEEKEAEEYFKR